MTTIMTRFLLLLESRGFFEQLIASNMLSPNSLLEFEVAQKRLVHLYDVDTIGDRQEAINNTLGVFLDYAPGSELSNILMPLLPEGTGVTQALYLFVRIALVAHKYQVLQKGQSIIDSEINFILKKLRKLPIIIIY